MAGSVSINAERVPGGRLAVTVTPCADEKWRQQLRVKVYYEQPKFNEDWGRELKLTSKTFIINLGSRAEVKEYTLWVEKKHPSRTRNIKWVKWEAKRVGGRDAGAGVTSISIVPVIAVAASGYRPPR